MINLESCSRTKFIEAYLEMGQERDYWREFAHDLEIKLQEYEGVKPTNEEAEKEFQKLFWAPYGKKGNLKLTRKRWFSLSNRKRKLAIEHLPGYVNATPDKTYRLKAEKFIKLEVWNDELPVVSDKFGRPTPVRAMTSIIEDSQTEDVRLAKAAKLREANQGRNVKDVLK